MNTLILVVLAAVGLAACTTVSETPPAEPANEDRNVAPSCPEGHSHFLCNELLSIAVLRTDHLSERFHPHDDLVASGGDLVYTSWYVARGFSVESQADSLGSIFRFPGPPKAEPARIEELADGYLVSVRGETRLADYRIRMQVTELAPQTVRVDVNMRVTPK